MVLGTPLNNDGICEMGNLRMWDETKGDMAFVNGIGVEISRIWSGGVRGVGAGNRTTLRCMTRTRNVQRGMTT